MKLSPNGWWLPDNDTLFAKYCAGPPPKRNGFYREHLQAALEFVTGWDLAVDVGAHVGFWGFDMAQRFRQVRCFEPVYTTYQCLFRNLAKFPHVRMYNVAVGNEMGSCTVHNDKTRPGNSGSNYVKPGGGKGGVLMVSLDEMALPACDFLKIDVEGFELRVLEGARTLIKTFRPVISMECTDWKFRDRYGIPEGQAERWLIKRGYRKVWTERPDAVFVPSDAGEE